MKGLLLLIQLCMNYSSMTNELLELFIKQTDYFQQDNYSIWVDEVKRDTLRLTYLRFIVIDEDETEETFSRKSTKQILGHNVFFVGTSKFFKSNYKPKAFTGCDVSYWGICFIDGKFCHRGTVKFYPMPYNWYLPVTDIQEVINSYGIGNWEGEAHTKSLSYKQPESYYDDLSGLRVFDQVDVPPTYKGQPWVHEVMKDFNQNFVSDGNPLTRIAVQFVISSEGELIAPRILQIWNDKIVNSPVLQTISMCEEGWTPGKIDDKSVNTLLTLPIAW